MRIRLWAVVIVALAISAALNSNATEWRTRSFELRLDRIYFPAGEESLIFVNSPFAILRNSDTILTGLIEHSWEGVSVTAPTHRFFDTLSLVSLEAAVTLAEIDSMQTILVGTDLGALAQRPGSSANPRVKWIEYADAGAMREDFATGQLDAVVTLSDLDPRPVNGTSLVTPCPFVAVMIPNISREFNYHGELTTSLYYRFDNNRLALCFRGDEVHSVNRLTPVPHGASPLPRWYDFDPARGKKLLERMSHRPLRVRLHSGHPALDGLTRYFADILSRDRCAVELTSDRALADINLEFVPHSDTLSRLCIDTLFRRLVRDSVSGRPPAEYLRRIDLELSGLPTSILSEDSAGRFETASRIMAEDLGVFPMFRPTLFVHTHPRLRLVRIAPPGYADFDSAMIVRLPQPPTGGTR